MVYSMVKEGVVMIPFSENILARVTEEEMTYIYHKIKTPIKHGAVIRWDEDYTDSPTVFQKEFSAVQGSAG